MSDKHSPADTEAVVPVASHAQETSDASVNVDNLEETLDMDVLGHAMPPLTPPAATEVVAPVASHAQETSDASVNVDNLEESLDMDVLGHAMPPLTPPAAPG